MDIPHISPKTGIKIIEALFPGVVYLAKKEKNGLPGLADIKTKSELLVKIIYSGLTKERYGQDIHKWLWENNMASCYFTNFLTTLPSVPPTIVHLVPPPHDGASRKVSCDGVSSPTFRCIHGLEDTL